MTDPSHWALAPDYTISRVINGCWQLTPDHGGGPANEQVALRAFGERVDAGMTTFDCADIYAGTEELLGRFRRALPDPDVIQIHTKLVPDKATLAELTDADIDKVIDRSRRRLGMERLDLVQFHWWDYAVPGCERVCTRLCEAQLAGKVRLIGATNFDTDHLRQMRAAGTPIVSLQTQYSLLDRRAERNRQANGANRQVPLLAYGALAGGFLSDRYRAQPSPQNMNRSLQKYRLIIDEAGGWETLTALLDVLHQIAKRHATSIDAVAARWVLDQPNVAAVILGVGRTSRAKHNALLFTLELDTEDHAQIAAQLSQQRTVPGDMYALERDPRGPHTKVIKTELQKQP